MDCSKLHNLPHKWPSYLTDPINIDISSQQKGTLKKVFVHVSVSLILKNYMD